MGYVIISKGELLKRVIQIALRILDLVTISIHTYERAPQLNSTAIQLALDSPLFRAELRCDPAIYSNASGTRCRGP